MASAGVVVVDMKEEKVAAARGFHDCEADTMTSGDGTGLFASTCGLILHMFLVALPKDIFRALTVRRKNVRGQTVVITGGASGIGQRMAEMFSLDEGANVAIIDVDQKKAMETCEDIVNRGGRAKYWICDITKDDAMNACADEIRREFGAIHIVVCNAAILYFGHVMDLKTDQLRRALDVNIMGTLITIRAFLPEMERVNSGHFVAIGSITGYYGETYGMAYCPSKFAVRGVMECLEMEMRDRGFDGIKCTTVCPWFIRTPMILNMGMRPTSRLVPFMSINRAATQILDAILKEKAVSFIPFMVSIIVLARGLLSHSMQKAGRSYLNCRYLPVNSDQELASSDCADQGSALEPQSKDESVASDPTMAKRSTTTSPDNLNNYFRFVPVYWYLIVVPALAFTFIVWYNPALIPVDYLPFLGPFAYKLGTEYSAVVGYINVFAWLAHTGEAIYSLYLCDQLGFTHAATFKWFIQTFIVGFSSLGLLKKLVRNKRKTKK